MSFKKSQKVNLLPAWTLSDYAESRGISYDGLRALKNRNSDFPDPIFNAAHKRFKTGKNLYYVHEVDAWIKKHNEAK